MPQIYKFFLFQGENFSKNENNYKLSNNLIKQNMAKKKKEFKKPELAIGGQAVIEGVLMRTNEKYAIAVRQPSGKIIVKKEKYISRTKKNKFLGLPFVRGIIMLWETLMLGYKALTFSANESLREQTKPGDKGKAGKNKKSKEALGTAELVITLIISILFALLLFKFLPLFIANLFKSYIGGSNILFNLIDGIAKLTIFIIYILLLSLMKDVQRLFQYHGAEHKVVHCYEHNHNLTVENVKKDSKAHARCGTTFILVVLLLSILFYLLIPFGVNFWLKLLIRILLLPVIAGIAYEWIKLVDKHPDQWYTKILSAPGLWVQGLTTKEPDDKQIEVAIKALKAVAE
jgi:uncharacterized protein YqhQ